MKLVFLGPPGAGKGTLSALAKDELKLPHISTGDIFRANIKNQTPLGVKVKAILDSGGLVSDDITIEIVKDRLAQSDCKAGFILDGFPRTVGQAEALARFAQPDAVINFVLADDEIVRRLSGRRVCKNCGASFHIDNLKPKKDGVCDSCGSELIIRKDDEPQAIQQRLVVYAQSTAPLIDFYKKAGLLKDIDAKPAPEAVLVSLKKALG